MVKQLIGFYVGWLLGLVAGSVITLTLAYVVIAVYLPQ